MAPTRSALTQRRWFVRALWQLLLVLLAMTSSSLAIAAAAPPQAGLASITVTPANAAIALGSQQQFVATGTYHNGSTENLTTTVTWSSSVAGVATISNVARSQGLASAVGQGSATITATTGRITGSTGLTVMSPSLVSIVVTPNVPAILFGQTQPFAAIGHYSDGSTQDITASVAWSSSTPAAATISSGGLATSVAQGATTITATAGAVSGATRLTVLPDATKVGSTSARGSILVFPRIEVGNGVDTLITLAHDGSTIVNLRCFYYSSTAVPTPSSSAPPAPNNHSTRFDLTLTHNQPLTWSAATGRVVGGATPKAASPAAPVFGSFSDNTTSTAGGLTCLATTTDATTGAVRPLNHDSLLGSALIVGYGASAQAWEYNAWMFEALSGTGASTPEHAVAPAPTVVDGVMTALAPLNGLSTIDANGNVVTPGSFAACPEMLLGTFYPPGSPADPNMVQDSTAGGTLNVTLASCSQDFTRAATSFVTRYIFTFWNQDEFARTGSHECADTWYESSFPYVSSPGHVAMQLASYASLGTRTAYVRIESTADTSVCGAGAQKVGFVGVISSSGLSGGFVRGRNLVGGSVNKTGFVAFEAQ